MRRTVIALAVLGLSGLSGPDVPAAEAGFCRLYCESITVGCKVTFGKIDEDYCEEWREGCVEGCRVAQRE